LEQNLAQSKAFYLDYASELLQKTKLKMIFGLLRDKENYSFVSICFHKSMLFVLWIHL